MSDGEEMSSMVSGLAVFARSLHRGVGVTLLLRPTFFLRQRFQELR
jgi:hypothetical protein